MNYLPIDVKEEDQIRNLHFYLFPYSRAEPEGILELRTCLNMPFCYKSYRTFSVNFVTFVTVVLLSFFHAHYRWITVVLG